MADGEDGLDGRIIVEKAKHMKFKGKFVNANVKNRLSTDWQLLGGSG